jgi:hypothetical protein
MSKIEDQLAEKLRLLTLKVDAMEASKPTPRETPTGLLESVLALNILLDQADTLAKLVVDQAGAIQDPKLRSNALNLSGGISTKLAKVHANNNLLVETLTH